MVVFGYSFLPRKWKRELPIKTVIYPHQRCPILKDQNFSKNFKFPEILSVVPTSYPSGVLIEFDGNKYRQLKMRCFEVNSLSDNLMTCNAAFYFDGGEIIWYDGTVLDRELAFRLSEPLNEFSDTFGWIHLGSKLYLENTSARWDNDTYYLRLDVLHKKLELGKDLPVTPEMYSSHGYYRERYVFYEGTCTELRELEDWKEIVKRAGAEEYISFFSDETTSEDDIILNVTQYYCKKEFVNATERLKNPESSL